MSGWPSWLPPEVVKSGAPWLLLSVFIMGIFTGRLRTQRELNTLTSIWEQRLQDLRTHASGLQELLEGYQALDRKRDEQVDELLEGNRVITTALKSLPDAQPTRHSQPEREQREPQRGRRPGPPRGGQDR